MSSFPKLEALVRGVLKDEARKGSTTKHGAATRVWSRVERLGGPSKFGIGTGAMVMGCMHYINNEVLRQFKSSLTDHEIEYILPMKLPDELIKMMVRVPRWIAIEDGSDALWMYWRMATAVHWQANAQLKRKKAEQTLTAARFSVEVADYMEAHGISMLGNVFREK